MKAGAALDALVAEKVMGLVPCSASHHHPRPSLHCWAPADDPQNGRSLDEYSTDIAAAWKVVERMDGAHDYWLALEHEGPTWGTAEFRKTNSPYFSSSADGTDALRICLAALTALGVELPTETPNPSVMP
jgi:hypothetical protein